MANSKEEMKEREQTEEKILPGVVWLCHIWLNDMISNCPSFYYMSKKESYFQEEINLRKKIRNLNDYVLIYF